MGRSPLPIDGLLPRIREALEVHRHAVIVAPPGSGKTTRVPPSLIDDGNVVLLQPRRVAARSLARRIATERQWTLGETIGWQIRFDRNASRSTRLLVCTEGILTAKLQSDPLLSEFRTVILDEFHERSIHADLALAMLRETTEARDDLRVIVMSATIDPSPIVEFLGGERECATIVGEGGLFPVTIEYRPGETVGACVSEALERTRGDVLVFLPGMREIERARAELSGRVSGIEISVLHGSLSPAEQDRAIAQGALRKVILSTNIAETSLTVEGVEAVVDGGLHKIIRFDDDAGIDRLVTERIPFDAADQRAGRAGRLRPGLALRLWDERDLLRSQREPEIDRIDLSPVVLDVLRWGADPRTFGWFERPEPERLESALALLESMGAVSRGQFSGGDATDRVSPVLTRIGTLMQRLPLPPRLARILIESRGSEIARRACAALAEGTVRGVEHRVAADSDLLHLADLAQNLQLRRSSDQLKSVLANGGVEIDDTQSDDEFRRAVLAGFPDRVAKARGDGTGRYQLASGQGAVLSERSSVRNADWIVAVDVSRGDGGRDALIHLASRICSRWLEPTSVETVHEYDEDADRVRAKRVMRYGALVLGEQPVAPDPAETEAVLRRVLLSRKRSEADRRLIARARFAGVTLDLERIASAAVSGKTSLGGFRLNDWIEWDERQAIDREAPERIEIPSGRSVTLDYREDGSVVASAKLQELFGLEQSPRVGLRRVPVTFALLAPNGRPVQMTSDLRSFWTNTYPEVRRELRGRYAKHPWPEDPVTATPTAGTKKQGRRDGK